MFSRRLPELAPNRLSRALERARAEGRRLLDLTSSDPTALAAPPAEQVAEVLRAAAADPSLRRHAPDPRGARAARDAVADALAARGQRIDPERLWLTTSTSEAYALVLRLLCDPGDAIVAPRPSYPLLDHLAALEAVQLERYPLSYCDGWFLDRERLAETVAGATRPRAIVVIQPNNPTGSAPDEAARTAIVALARRHALAVVADEVFIDYPLDAPPPRPWSEEREVLSFSFGGLSKACALPQWKLGWIVVAGPDEAVAAAQARMEVLFDAYLSVGALTQAALPGLLRLGATLRAAVHAHARARYAWLRARVGGSAVELLRTDGGWSAVLQLPRSHDDEAWALRLLERGVLVQPGYFYDDDAPARIVVSLLTPAEVMEEAVGVVCEEAG